MAPVAYADGARQDKRDAERINTESEPAERAARRPANVEGSTKLPRLTGRKAKPIRAEEIPDEDWDAICAIVLLFGGDGRRLCRLDQPVEDLVEAFGRRAVRLSGHHFPVYRLEPASGTRRSRVDMVIDQGDHRFHFLVRASWR